MAGTLGGCGQPWKSELVSTNGAGADSGNAESIWPRVSQDGTKIAFTSAAGDLGPTDTTRPPDQFPGGINAQWDVYVRDLTTGVTTLVSANAGGTNSGNNRSWDPVLSPDGNKVAFTSWANDLGPTDPGGDWDSDIYVRDLTTGVTQLVTRNAAGTDGQGGWFPDFSPDSTKIAFSSAGAAFGPVDTNNTDDVYVRNLTTGAVSLVSTNAAGTDAAADYSHYPDFSPDGTKIVFDSNAGNFGPADSNAAVDIYLRDLTTGVTTLVSANAAGTDTGDAASRRPAFSPDGTRIVFESDASNLGALDTNGVQDLYVRNLGAGQTVLVSFNGAGNQAGNGISVLPIWGPDSSTVLFESDATDIAANDLNGIRGDVFVRDLDAQTTTLVSVNGAGTGTANHHSFLAAFSPSGTKVAFISYGNDLGPKDTQRPGDAFFSGDVYLRDLTTGTTTLVSVNANGTDSSNGTSASDRPAFVSETQVAFQSRGSDLGATDTNGVDDIYLGSFTGT
jgi:Tol biopolymer transport system component